MYEVVNCFHNELAKRSNKSIANNRKSLLTVIGSNNLSKYVVESCYYKLNSSCDSKRITPLLFNN